MEPLTPNQQAAADVLSKLVPLVATAPERGHVMPELGYPTSADAPLVTFRSVFSCHGSRTRAERELERLKDQITSSGISREDVVTSVTMLPKGASLLLTVYVGDMAQ